VQSPLIFVPASSTVIEAGASSKSTKIRTALR
jgi:hypothetical protein